MPTAHPLRKRGFRYLQAEWRESLAMAIDSILSHKLRSALTLLGILIGVFSIIVVMTVLRVLDRNAQSSLTQLGPHTFSVKRTPSFVFVSPSQRNQTRQRKEITMAQGLAVSQRAKLPLSVGLQEGFAMGLVRSAYEETNPDVQLIGVTPESFAGRNWVVDEGRALQQQDLDSARLVTVMGASLAKKLFPHGSAVGQRITFEGLAYQVVGVLESKGQMIGGDQDNFIVTPLTTAIQRYSGPRFSLTLLVQASGQETYEDTVEEVRGLMRAIRKVRPGDPDDFEIASNDSLMAQFRQVTFAVRAGVGLISSIALLAAGVGIMNIMLISVTERTKEIGIRRAIGARKSIILSQFMLEAIILCQIGGLVGVILGVSSGNILSFVFKVPIVLPIDWMIYGLLICTLVGVIFGTYPALKAANTDPIDALRYE